MSATLARTFVTATLLGLFVPAAHALDAAFHYKAGYDTGGETLVTVRFTNGDTSNIKANRGFFFGGGVSFVNDAKDIETEIALTYKIDDVTATNGSVTWSRWPVDALVFYRMPSVRFGGGLTYHLSPNLSGSGLANGLNVDFKTALGYILQVDYRLTDKMNLGVRYTALDYELSGTTNAKVGSNGFGIVFSGHL